MALMTRDGKTAQKVIIGCVCGGGGGRGGNFFSLQHADFFSLKSIPYVCDLHSFTLYPPLRSGKLSMDSFSIGEHALYQIEFISQRQGEETQVDPLSQSMLVEHHHVDDVGRTTN